MAPDKHGSRQTLAPSSELRRLRPRLIDVAELAGTSKPIASRALNHDPTLVIGSELRERIRHAAQTLGYQPHAAARSLRRSASGAIGLLVPDLTNPAYALIIRGAFRRAAERGFVVLLLEDRNGDGADAAVAELVQAVRIDGLIVASAVPGHPLFSVLDEYPIPHVFGNRAVAGSSRNVTMDDPSSSALAVDYLADLGHRCIAHVSGPLTVDASLRRATGFSERAAARGLTAVFEEAPGFLERGGADAAERLLTEHPEVTGIYTSSVSQAAGLLHVAWKLGIAVPDELSVLAYADTPLAAVLTPPLTAIGMPFAELGASCVDAVIAQREGREPHDIVVDTSPSLVMRSSAGPPPANPRVVV